jgi:hypothetical protein
VGSTLWSLEQHLIIELLNPLKKIAELQKEVDEWHTASPEVKIMELTWTHIRVEMVKERT